MADHEELHLELTQLTQLMSASADRSEALAEASLACLEAARLAWSALDRPELCEEALHATRAASLAIRFAMVERSGVRTGR